MCDLDTTSPDCCAVGCAGSAASGRSPWEAAAAAAAAGGGGGASEAASEAAAAAAAASAAVLDVAVAAASDSCGWSGTLDTGRAVEAGSRKLFGKGATGCRL
jgi:hypothetical protein